MHVGHLVLMCFNDDPKSVDYETGIGLMLGKSDYQFILPSKDIRHKGIFVASNNTFAENKVWNFTHYIKLI
jgi:hypothetical protein